MDDFGDGDLDSEWLGRNPRRMIRKRERQQRSYGNDWGAYEARGSGQNGSQRQKSGDGCGAIDSASYDGTSRRHRHHQEHPPQHGGQPQHHPANSFSPSNAMPTAAGERVGNPYGTTNGNGEGGGRLRVPDLRKGAARIGAPLVDCGSSRFPSHVDRGGLKSSSTQLDARLSSEFARTVSSSHRPKMNVTLPPELRSTLNLEQLLVVESVLSGNSTFFTGPAGSGKSHILSTILKANELGLGGRNGGSKPRKIVVTATTGIAACNVGGTTVHSFAGVGAGTGSAAEIVKRVMGNEYTKTRWREVDVLIVDEISMMAGAFLDKIGFVASRARNDRRPFGGVQLVVCGDFFQLPPVDLAKEGFAFESECWTKVIKCSVLLKQVFRQKGDPALMNVLDEARVGQLSTESANILRRHGSLSAAPSHRRNDRNGDGGDREEIVPTLLECRNKQVDRANVVEMAKLPGESHAYDARDRAVSDSHTRQLRHCQAPQRLELKVGAQVMLLKNVDPDKGLVNGSRGVVVRFQNPLNVGDMPRGFKKVLLPVVRFDAIRAVGSTNEDDNENDEDKEFVIQPEEWTNKVGDQTVSARVQIPLRSAWAISVHKSQGMTIPNLTVNLAGVFEYGQAYVALSRATELKLLTLRGFSEKAFRAHPKVKEFYRLLENPDASFSSSTTNREERNDKENGNQCARFGHHSTVNCPPQDRFSASTTTMTTKSSPQHAKACRKQQQSDGPFNPYATRCGGPVVSTTTMTARGVNPVSRVTPPITYPHSSIQPLLSVAAHSSSLRPPSTTPPPVVTQEQLRRMEENRQRALAIRMQKRQKALGS